MRGDGALQTSGEPEGIQLHVVPQHQLHASVGGKCAGGAALFSGDALVGAGEHHVGQILRRETGARNLHGAGHLQCAVLQREAQVRCRHDACFGYIRQQQLLTTDANLAGHLAVCAEGETALRTQFTGACPRAAVELQFSGCQRQRGLHLAQLQIHGDHVQLAVAQL